MDGEMRFYLLEFAEDRQKICVSPSIGRKEIDPKREERFRKAFEGFRYLSCREKQGAQEITRISGRPCEWLVDPTLYLTRNEWKTLLSVEKKQGEPYILLFFLGGISEALLQCVKEYATGRFRIVNPSDSKDPSYSCDPAEFVSLIANAHLVFTDSFHATAFSANFHVPFYVFERNQAENMTSRIESICELLGMSDRCIHKQESLQIEEACDFEGADKQLAIERQKFSEYLDRCFKE